MPQQGAKKPKSFPQPFYRPPTIQVQEAANCLILILQLGTKLFVAPFLFFFFFFMFSSAYSLLILN